MIAIEEVLDMRVKIMSNPMNLQKVSQVKCAINPDASKRFKTIEMTIPATITIFAFSMALY